MPLLIGFVCLAVYAWITPPVSGLGDGPEFTVGLATAGLVHPPGYPLFILAGHVFVRAVHGLGATWAWAANAWSGAGAAVAVALCFMAARRLAGAGDPHSDPGRAVPKSRWSGLVPGLLPAALLAVNPVLLREAAEAEINSWALAWTMGMALAFVAGVPWAGGEARAPTARRAALWGLLCGIGLAHHLTSTLVSAPLTAGLALLLARRGRLRAGLVAAALLGAAAPLLGYLFVAWRAAHPAPGQWLDIAPTVQSVLDHATGRRYRDFLGYFAPDAVSRALLASGVYPILLPGLLLLGVAGARAVTPEGRAAYWSLLAAAMITLLFTLNYGVPDPAPYLLPAVGISLLGLAPVAAAIAQRRGAWSGAALAAAALLVAALAWGGLSDARARREIALRFDREVRSLWGLVPDRKALLFWNADQVTRLVEYQVLRNEKRNVWVASPEWLLDPPVRALVRRRFGADPIEGMEIPYAPLSAPWGEAVRRNFFGAVLARLGARTGLPVYWLDPTIPRLTLIRNPGPPDGRTESGHP